MAYHHHSAEQTGATRTLRIAAEVAEVEVAPWRSYRTWVYDGKFPGGEIRVKEGDRLHIAVENRLPEETTIHWHGVPLPNAMDGVPVLTQRPIKPGEQFVYDYVADPAGTYIYHSHVGLQLDRGLMGPLIIEEKQPHVQYDRDYVLLLDDFLPHAPEPIPAGGGMMGTGSGRMTGMMQGMSRGQGGMMGGGMMGVEMPPYAGIMINGRLPEAPVVFDTRKGERLRLRFLNASGASAYRVAIGGHRMAITHTDGRPVKPLAVDSFYIGMGERYDVLVEANNSGAWWIAAAPLEANLPAARAILRYLDSPQARPVANSLPEGLQSGHLLDISELESTEPLPTAAPDQNFDFVLSGGMMMSSAWTMNGQAYPNADPVEIHEGSWVRVKITNHSMMLHPMHLHGHFFRVANVLKDTLIIPPMMGRGTFQFLADNPGRWFFHCHNAYHMEAGMAREVRYV